MMKRKLAGGVALVTGASSGIGWQTALHLAQEGMRLCLSARREEPLRELKEELTRRGAEAMVVTGDVTDADGVEHVVRECVARYSRIDLLVNVPSVQLFSRFEDYRWEEIVRIMDVNFFGYLRLTRAALPVFRRQKRGHIINVLSVFSEMGFPLFSVYAASKHALRGWADSLRMELHGSGIHVSDVLLPSIATPFYDVAPTRLERLPRPAPPVYSPDWAARAVVRSAIRPNSRRVPSLVQGRLALAAKRWIPALVETVLARVGPSLVTGRRTVHRPEGNLFAAPERPFGPKGTARVTPTWLRRALLAGNVAGLIGVAAFSARRFGIP